MALTDLYDLKTIDRDNLPAFDNDLSIGYNGRSGRYLASLIFKRDTLPESKLCPIPLYNSKCAALQQAVIDNLEDQNILFDPQKHNIQVRKISPSFILHKGRAKHKKLDDCNIDEIRLLPSTILMIVFYPNRPNQHPPKIFSHS